VDASGVIADFMKRFIAQTRFVAPFLDRSATTAEREGIYLP
jgi:hypothetical protein